MASLHFNLDAMFSCYVSVLQVSSCNCVALYNIVCGYIYIYIYINKYTRNIVDLLLY